MVVPLGTDVLMAGLNQPIQSMIVENRICLLFHDLYLLAGPLPANAKRDFFATEQFFIAPVQHRPTSHMKHLRYATLRYPRE